MKNFFAFTCISILLFACSGGSEQASNDIETIPNISATMQITSGLDANDKPINNVDYFPPQLGKAYAYIHLEQIPNGQHKFQCKVSRGEQKNVFQGETFNFKVSDGKHKLWSWVEFEKLQGPGEYTFDIYIDEKMILRAPFSILNPTQMNSNYPAYWLDENLYAQYDLKEAAVTEQWKVQSIAFMEDPIVSVNVIPYKKDNRFFVTTMSPRGERKMYEIKKNEKVLIRDFGVGPVEEVQFHTSYGLDHINLITTADTFNMRVSLISGEWKEIGSWEAYDWPKERQFRTRTGSGEQYVSFDCKDGIRYVDGKSFSTITYFDCDVTKGWATWHQNDQLVYFSNGKGVFMYDAYNRNNPDRKFEQILFDPTIRYLQYFQNHEKDFLAFSKGKQLQVATNLKGYAFQSEYNYENKFRRLLKEWSIYETSKTIEFYPEPKVIIDHTTSFEIEGEQMIVEEVGTITDGSYREQKLWRMYKSYYYDKGSESLYENVDYNYMIKYPGMLVFLKNHMASEEWLNDFNIAIPDAGFSLNRHAVFSSDDQFHIDSNTQFGQLLAEKYIKSPTIELELVASVASYDSTKFELLGDDFYKQKEDDGSINKLMPDGRRLVYQYAFKDYSITPEKINLDDYVIFTTRSCDGSKSDIASVHDLDEAALSEIGSINEQPIYSFNDQNHQALKSAYDSYKTALEESGVLEYDDSYNLMSYDDFLTKPSIFYWKDPFGRYIRFSHKELLPPLNCEPIVYFYPVEPQEIDFKLDEKIDVLASYPKYHEGWKMMVNPDGKILDAKTGAVDHRVFWEGISGLLPSLTRGHVVAKAEVDGFLSERLQSLGLNDFEIAEFKEAWLSYLTEKEYCFIGFYNQELISQYAPINIEPKPETVIRVLMDYRPLDEFTEVLPPKLQPTPERNGFTVVEWGGLKR